MNDHMDLERRLRRVADDIDPPVAHKEALRAALQRRAVRRRRERPVTVVLALAAFVAVTLTGTKNLESYRFFYGGAERNGYDVVVRPHDDSYMARVYSKGDKDGRRLTITEEEVMQWSKESAILDEMHMAGMTRRLWVMGRTIQGKDFIQADYESPTDSFKMRKDVQVIDETLTVPGLPELDYEYAFSDLFQAHFRDFAFSTLDTALLKVVEIDGELVPLMGKAYDGGKFGEIILWMDHNYYDGMSDKRR